RPSSHERPTEPERDAANAAGEGNEDIAEVGWSIQAARESGRGLFSRVKCLNPYDGSDKEANEIAAGRQKNLEVVIDVFLFDLNDVPASRIEPSSPQ
ncbi:hypothetical protein V5O48_018255, partial [Marasmius crinis-equi]